MNINDFLSISIVGTLLSAVVQFIKVKFGTVSLATKFITIFGAMAIGAVYYFFSQTIWWQAMLGVLGVASTIYAFFLKDDRI